ncbi:hypothetical protein J2W51_005834 [Tardiphaga robiniae]|jgi:hypothetical protein|nr:hypothetical protein [Tardiphaga robiniae]
MEKVGEKLWLFGHGKFPQAAPVSWGGFFTPAQPAHGT